MARTPPPGTLQAVYGPASSEETRDYYEKWAADYDADTVGQGFRIPYLAAAFLARYAPASASPVLDAACGTGVVGDALALLGYAPLTGVDLTPAMLARARARGIYAALHEGDIAALPFADGTFAATACIGAFGPGHAPPSALGELARVTAPGGHIVFNVRADTWRDQGFEAAIERLTDAGRWRQIERSRPFRVYLLNDLDLSAIIFVFRVT
ncbi:class I SAM-dependent methyltransferase [Acuticoccus sediminis]|uniref:Class I SAM-dependent methyltransferase n=1 Tax=Acuticoccus sediminis TaxID=2184697 RepID=A0A8B2NLT5_9HYPH|nr:class I SAM-dependent methyltransferase [Acuticoccus sediminis]RAH99500.1 class I SAM-dependent methyltransferase [Acuticoccus sediminis]